MATAGYRTGAVLLLLLPVVGASCSEDGLPFFDPATGGDRDAGSHGTGDGESADLGWGPYPVPGCQAFGGLQAGAPWPTHRYCPTRPGLSPYIGPATIRVRWRTPIGA